MKYLKLLNLVLLFVSCYAYTTNAQCMIEGVSVEINNMSDCNIDGTYNAGLYFEVVNTTNDFFDVWFNDEFKGFYDLDDLPLMIDNITPRPNSDFDIVRVCINDNSDCCAVFEYEQPDCSNCEFTIFELHTFNCSAVGVYDVQFLLNENEFGGDSFDLYANDTLLYNDEPLNTYEPYPITNSTQSVDEIKICVAGTDCCEIVEVEAPNCNCNVVNDIILENTFCESSQFYQINLDYVDNGSEQFTLLLGNTPASIVESVHNYSDLPIIIGPINPLLWNNQTIITVLDETGDCSTSTSFGYETCEPVDCVILNVLPLSPMCNGDGTFNINIAVSQLNTGDEGYSVFVNGAFEGSYSYSNTFSLINNLTSDTGDSHTIEVVDNEATMCSFIYELAPVYCSECAVSEILISDINCNEDGTYKAQLDVDIANSTNDFIDVFVNNEFYDFYAIADLPITLENITPRENSNEEHIRVCVNDNPDCCLEYEFPEPNCSAECGIELEWLEIQPCNENGEIFVHLGVISSNPNQFSFELNGNGNNYGTFDYGSTHYNIGPLPQDVPLEFIATDVSFENCMAVLEQTEVHCPNNDDCGIELEWLEIQPCNENGEIFVHLGVISSNPNQFSFELNGNGNNYGTFDYGSTHYNIGPLPQDVPLEFIATDVSFENCMAVLEQTEVHCPNNDDCVIGNAEMTQINCNPDGTYNGVLTMDYQNATNDFFDLWINNEFSGFYSLDALPLSLENITPRANSEDEHILVCINDDPNCCFEFEYPDPNCTAEDDCIFTDLIVETLDCNDDNQFMISVDIVVEGTITGTVGLLGNGENYGTYQPSDFPIELGPFAANTGVPYELIAFHNQNESCITVTFGQNCNDYVCYGFEDQMLGSIYNLNNTIENGIAFELDDIAVLYNGFTNFDGTTDAGNLEIQTTPVAFLENNTLYLNDASATFVFANTALPVFQFTIDYLEASGIENIAVNGQSPLIIDHLGQLPFEILPNVTVTNEVFEVVDNSFYGRLTFTGDIQTILIGGQDLYLDNTCVEYALPPNPPSATNVWPGDANNDNIVNHFDLLNVGLAFGTAGEARLEQGNNWSPVAAFNWETAFENGVNHKYADCNGNGLIEDTDVIAINENYGLLHGEEPVFEAIDVSEDDPSFYVELPNANDFIEDQEVQIPIILGSNDVPVEQIYGLAFTFKFSEGLFQNMDFEFDFSDGVFGDLDDVLMYNQTVFENNQIEVAITRKDQQNVALVNGQLGHFIGIIDDLAGMTEVDVELINVVAIDAFENRIALHTPVSTVDLTTSTTRILSENAVHIFPNPTKHTLTIQNKYQQEIESIQVINIIGQSVLEIIPEQENIQLNVSNLTNGLYFLQVHYDGAQHIQKFQVHR